MTCLWLSHWLQNTCAKSHSVITLCHHTLTSVITIAEAHLVHVGLGDGVLLHHGVTKHVPRGVLRGHPHVLEATVATSLSVHDAVHKVAGYTVPGIIGIVGI